MITKIEAAERQLDTAIKLFFENVGHLSCYTLAAVSREITDDLCEKQKSELYRAELERLGDPQRVRLSFRDEMEILIKPEHRKEAMRLLKKAQNFLKHADRDHDKELEDISAEEVSLLIFSGHKKLCTSSKANVSGHGYFSFLVYSRTSQSNQHSKRRLSEPAGACRKNEEGFFQCLQ
jgi:hypothetical protein